MRPETQFFDLGYAAEATGTVLEALASGYCGGHSPFIESAEKNLAARLGCGFILTTNGTVALELALRATGVRPGDCVAVSSRSFVATANAVLAVGAVPLFISQERSGLGMCPESLRSALDNRPDLKVVVVAHLYGSAPTIREIASLCEDRGCVLIEDAAQAFGQSRHGRQLGTWGRFGTFSFFSNKVLACGEGGGIACQQDIDCRLLAELRYHGAVITDTGDFIELRAGTNARLNALSAALLYSQITCVERLLQARLLLAEHYRILLVQLEQWATLACDDAGVPLSLWCAVLRGPGGKLWRPEQARRLELHMRRNGVACRLGMPWLPTLPHLRGFERVNIADPNRQGVELLCPIHPGMDYKAVERVVATLCDGLTHGER